MVSFMTKPETSPPANAGNCYDETGKKHRSLKGY